MTALHNQVCAILCPCDYVLWHLASLTLVRVQEGAAIMIQSVMRGKLARRGFKPAAQASPQPFSGAAAGGRASSDTDSGPTSFHEHTVLQRWNAAMLQLLSVLDVAGEIYLPRPRPSDTQAPSLAPPPPLCSTFVFIVCEPSVARCVLLYHHLTPSPPRCAARC